MPIIRLPQKFIERCQRYLMEHPEAAEDVQDLILRCGRLGLWYLDKLLTEEEKRDCPSSDDKDEGGNPPAMEGDVDDERPGKVIIYIPEKEHERVRKLVVEKLGIVSTVTAWYVLCTFMVLYGYWELPPKI
jgi:hypothetical protein